MLIYCLRISKAGGGPNFGDELGRWLWPKLLNPKMGAILPECAFYSIGTLLGSPMPFLAKQYVIFGSGAGYRGVPEPTANWRTYFVRGPMTAKHMGGVPWITDPALLVAQLAARQETAYPVSFMPRHDAKFEEEKLESLGIHLIRPNWLPEIVIDEISKTGLLLSNTLHGAVVANALRVPWISIRGDNPVHDFKWHDWCRSLDMVWNPITEPLKWAIDYAVPQLSAASVSRRRLVALEEQVAQFNDDVENGRVFA